jgi:predicted amino acid-binding ACT domain protein
MKSLQKITQEISEITLEIEEKYPELYRDLIEMPVTLSIPSKNEDTVTTKDLSAYLDTLKITLQKEIELHLKK